MTDLPPPAPLQPPPEPPPRARRRWVAPVAVAAVVALAAWGAWTLWGRDDASGAKAQGTTKDAKAGTRDGKAGKAGKGGRFGDPNRPQPVSAVAARVGDMNIVQTALGTVTASRTVTVRPRVDGLLQNVLFTEGQLVKQGEAIAQIDPVPFQVQLAQAEGNLARDAAQLNNARLDLERYRKLLAQDSVASQQVDQQAAQVRQFEGTVKVDQAQVDNAKLQLSYTRITAPISGRLGLRLVDPGNMVRGSDANGIAVITQIDPIAVLFTIPQDALPRVLGRLRGGEKLPVEAWDREQKAMLAKGELVTTDNQIDVATGTVRLKAQFPNADGRLFPNQFVNVRMVVDVRKGVMLVPAAAIQRGAQGTVVYVVKDDNTVTLRPVQTGPTEGLSIAVESGLQAGERVVTDGVDRLREGGKVEVIEQRAPGAGGGGGRQGGGDPAKREEMRKRMEGMTPEQREAFRKKMQEGGGAPSNAPPPAVVEPKAPAGAKPVELVPKAPATPAAPSAEPRKGDEAATPEQREERRKRLESMSPEEREERRKRFESMTPEQREEFRKRRAEREKAAQ